MSPSNGAGIGRPVTEICPSCSRIWSEQFSERLSQGWNHWLWGARGHSSGLLVLVRRQKGLPSLLHGAETLHLTPETNINGPRQTLC